MRVVYIPDAVRWRRVFHWHFAYKYAVVIHLLNSDDDGFFLHRPLQCSMRPSSGPFSM